MSKPVSAADLIAAAKAAKNPIPPELRAELAKLLKYNDTVPRDKRVTREQARALCKAHGLSVARSGFDAIISREFNRTWSGAGNGE